MNDHRSIIDSDIWLQTQDFINLENLDDCVQRDYSTDDSQHRPHCSNRDLKFNVCLVVPLEILIKRAVVDIARE